MWIDSLTNIKSRDLRANQQLWGREARQERKKDMKGGGVTVSFVRKEFGGFFLNVGLTVNNYTSFH